MRIGAAKGSGGYSLIELILATSVLAVASVSTVAVISFSSRMARENKEFAAAKNLAQKKVEVMRACEFSEIFARFNSTYTDDPPTGMSPGSFFYIHDTMNYADERSWYDYYENKGYALGGGGDNSYDYLPDPYLTLLQPPRKGVTGTISFAAAGRMLREDTALDGTRWDLNLDGDINDAFDSLTPDPADPVRILPVTITIRWERKHGVGEFVLQTVLDSRY